MKDLLLSLGWVDKGDILVRYTDPRIGWKPEDGTLIVGYDEYPSKVFTPQLLFSIIQMTPGEATALIDNPLTWEDIRRIVQIADSLVNEPDFCPETEQEYYEEVLKQYR